MLLCTLLAALALPASGAAASAMYVPLDPHELALRAHLVVEGTIVDFDHAAVRLFSEEASEARFTVRVDRVVAGTYEEDSLAIRQFADWTCAGRYAPYEIGQRAVFHLAYPTDERGAKKVDEAPRVLSGGNEGEVVLREGEALTTLSWDGCRRVRLDGGGWGKLRTALDEEQYVALVRELRRLFDAHPVRKPSGYVRYELRRIASREEVERFRASSGPARALIEELEDDRNYVGG